MMRWAMLGLVVVAATCGCNGQTGGGSGQARGGIGVPPPPPVPPPPLPAPIASVVVVHRTSPPPPPPPPPTIGSVATFSVSHWLFTGNKGNDTVTIFAVDSSCVPSLPTKPDIALVASGASSFGLTGLAIDPTESFIFALGLPNSQLQPFAIATPSSTTIVLTPGTGVTTGTLPQAIGMDRAGGADRFFTADVDTISEYAYTSGGVVSPPMSRLIPRSGVLTSRPDCVIIDAKGDHLYAGFQADTDVQPVAIKGGVLQKVNDALVVSCGQNTGAGPTALALHPSGKFLYVANGDGTIQVFLVSGLTLTQPNNSVSGLYNGSPLGGQTNQYGTTIGFTAALAVNAKGTFLVCVNPDATSSVQAFELTSGGEDLKHVGKPYKLKDSKPYGVVFHPDEDVVYVADAGTHQLSALKVSTTGLTPLPGSPYDLPAGDTEPTYVLVR